jgi:septum site-determining protein MinC
LDGETMSLPTIRVRGRSIMALVLTPEFPFGEWFAGLDRQLAGSPGFYADRPVVADLSALKDLVERESLPVVLDGLAARNLRIVGVEGVPPARLAGTRWAEAPTSLNGRDVALAPRAPGGSPPGAHGSDLAGTPAEVHPVAAGSSLLVDRPVRSGESLVFEEGDVIVVGSVASGAEVIAGGSVHVYGVLRGRAIAGLRVTGSRIFCRRMEAEMVGVDTLFRTAETWGADLQGRAVMVRCDRGALSLSALD